MIQAKLAEGAMGYDIPAQFFGPNVTIPPAHVSFDLRRAENE